MKPWPAGSIDLADGAELAYLRGSVATSGIVAVSIRPGEFVGPAAVTCLRFNSTVLCCRGSRAVRIGVLAIVAFCQMPLPVGHDHEDGSSLEVTAGAAGEALQRHLALFHSGRATQTGWHIHLVPAPFWLGGAAGDSTGMPAPEVEGGAGAPLPAVVTADGFAPSISILDVVCSPARPLGNQIGVMVPASLSQSVHSAADRIVLLGAMLC